MRRVFKGGFDYPSSSPLSLMVPTVPFNLQLHHHSSLLGRGILGYLLGELVLSA